MLLKGLWVSALFLITDFANTGIKGNSYVDSFSSSLGISAGYRTANRELLNLYKDHDIVYDEAIQGSSAFKLAGLEDFSITDYVEGDGNCQFRAVSLIAYGHQNYHKWLRGEAVAHLREHPDWYRPSVAGDWQEYLQEMAQDGTYGDDHTLTAMAFDLLRKFVVLKETNGDVDIFEKSWDNISSGTAFLSLRNQHYEVIFRDW
ncbi:uncharacterized protein MELLADRAFT_66967 [Melampsora larici-populina 98AG31]|uniref:OTU domain-containing protein n=1 Tax=Melampsora larici-populina (strain 98AG31 / pathotype 3-4-7) TaxID=747676 RepID=F4S1B0_MELLP|nr:uncharacterized protein MELLADRAFT_66967 [Melampsora larici-populina 98AG31]EGG01530.1 hypothetical protein MELLADRAFT_66967 [Melampsora larici-populina 98AG31]